MTNVVLDEKNNLLTYGQGARRNLMESWRSASGEAEDQASRTCGMRLLRRVRARPSTWKHTPAAAAAQMRPEKQGCIDLSDRAAAALREWAKARLVAATADRGSDLPDQYRRERYCCP